MNRLKITLIDFYTSIQKKKGSTYFWIFTITYFGAAGYLLSSGEDPIYSRTFGKGVAVLAVLIASIYAYIAFFYLWLAPNNRKKKK